MNNVHRVALFVSHYHGHAVLAQLLRLHEALRVVLVATDYPASRCCNAGTRLWRYGWDEELRQLVPRLAAEAGLEAYTGYVGREGGLFHERFLASGAGAILATVFGQRVPRHLLDLVGHRAWNVHPVVPGLPLEATRGPQPFEAAYALGAREIQLCLHQMTGAYDTGEEVARSEPFPLPRANHLGPELFLELQRRTASLSADLVRRALPPLLGPLGADPSLSPASA